MRRSAWNIFAALSLLIFAVSATLFVRSWFVGDGIAFEIDQTDRSREPRVPGTLLYALESGRGAVCILRARDVGSVSSTPPGWNYAQQRPPERLVCPPGPDDRINLEFAGFQLQCVLSARDQKWFSYQLLVLPLWLIAGAAAIPPLLWWRRWRRSRGRGFPVEPCSTELTNEKNLAIR